MRSYKTVRADYEYLASVDSDADLVEIDAEVFGLMENPTKQRAAEMYESAIQLWFSNIGCTDYVSRDVLNDKKVVRIGKKYGYLPTQEQGDE